MDWIACKALRELQLGEPRRWIQYSCYYSRGERMGNDTMLRPCSSY
jgi:hypothetical protein